MTWRAIQDTVPSSESLARLSDFAERLYWRMVSQSDHKGRLPGIPAKVRALCAPLLAVLDDDVAAAITEITEAGRILVYHGRRHGRTVSVIQLVDFETNQPRDALRAARPSKFPDPPCGESRQVAAGRGELPYETETEMEMEKGSPTAVSRPADRLPSAISRDELVTSISAQLADADDHTTVVLTSIAKGLPEAALHTALESLSERRARLPKLASEARYLVATLKRMKTEGQYPSSSRGD